MNDEQRKAMFAKQSSKGHGLSSGIRAKNLTGRTIKNYGDLEAIGFKTPESREGIPLDCIIEGNGDNYKVVGYRGGSTFSSESLKHIPDNLKKYFIKVESDPEGDYGSYYARDDKIAKRLVKESLKDGTKFRLIEITPKFRLIK